MEPTPEDAAGVSSSTGGSDNTAGAHGEGQGVVSMTHGDNAAASTVAVESEQPGAESASSKGAAGNGTGATVSARDTAPGRASPPVGAAAADTAAAAEDDSQRHPAPEVTSSEQQAVRGGEVVGQHRAASPTGSLASAVGSDAGARAQEGVHQVVVVSHEQSGRSMRLEVVPARVTVGDIVLFLHMASGLPTAAMSLFYDNVMLVDGAARLADCGVIPHVPAPAKPEPKTAYGRFGSQPTHKPPKPADSDTEPVRSKDAPSFEALPHSYMVDDNGGVSNTTAARVAALHCATPSVHSHAPTSCTQCRTHGCCLP